MYFKEISLAPMLDVTTPHFRRIVRFSSPSTVLFTEMIVSNTVTNIETEKLLQKLGHIDSKTVVQIGGSCPFEITKAIKILQEHGCTLFNLNVGCPSSKVQKGAFGAILMKNRELVQQIINKVYDECNTVLSLKIRTGVDEYDSYEYFSSFVKFLVKTTPVEKFYVHARKCWLKGVSPKQNRNIPPLNYEFVYKIKEEFPHIQFILNGGLKGPKDYCKIANLDGIMIGREALKNILCFRSFDEFHESKCILTVDLIKIYLEEYGFDNQVNYRIIAPLQHIMHGIKGSKAYKVMLNACNRNKVTIGQLYENIILFIGDL